MRQFATRHRKQLDGTIAVTEEASGVTLEVRDRGRGLSEEVRANALLPFYSTKRAGSGLGLSLAREIVDAHGGSISLHARDGGGTIVRLRLPGPPEGEVVKG